MAYDPVVDKFSISTENALPLPVTLAQAAINSYFRNNSVAIGNKSIDDVVQECTDLAAVVHYLRSGEVGAAVLSKELQAHRAYMVRVIISNALKYWIDSGAGKQGKKNYKEPQS